MPRAARNFSLPHWRVCALGVGLCLIILRAPLLFIEPRLWAEEGTRYFVEAQKLAGSGEWYKALAQVHVGYFSLWPNLAATVAANVVPLESAPLVTTIAALLVQLAAFAVVLWLDSEMWLSSTSKVLACLVILFVPLSAEVWLTTANSQFLFALITFLILSSRVSPEAAKRWSCRILLVLGGLSGIASTLLTPLFAIAAFVERSRERWTQTIMLGLCSIVQGSILVVSLLSDRSLMSKRVSETSWETLVAIVGAQSIGMVLGGLENMRVVVALIRGMEGPVRPDIGVLAAILLVAECAVIWLLSAGLDRRHRVAAVGSYLVLVGASVLGSLGADKLVLVTPGGGQRYFFAPNAILMLMVVGSLQRYFDTARTADRSRWLGVGLGAVLGASLFWGMWQFGGATVYSAEWPAWRDEIRAWRNDPEHIIEIWPPGWRIRLVVPKA